MNKKLKSVSEKLMAEFGPTYQKLTDVPLEKSDGLHLVEDGISEKRAFEPFPCGLGLDPATVDRAKYSSYAIFGSDFKLVGDDFCEVRGLNSTTQQWETLKVVKGY